MADLENILKEIDSLSAQIAAKGKLSEEVFRKIEYHFRLECNYHSNRIEGGTLTKPETRSVMIGNISVDGKPLKDIREMKGHDTAMLQILRVGQGKIRLSPKRIKEIHRTIIIEENPEKQGEIGNWKQTGNYIINERGEIFNFTPPDEVAEKMQNLLNWLNAGLDKIHSKKKNAPSPLLLAFEFHLRFLTIHPFLDGNGRAARIATNLVLTSCGFPPFWVSEGAEKEAYNRYLTDIQGYGGGSNLFFVFLATLLKRSFSIILEALNVENNGGGQ